MGENFIIPLDGLAAGRKEYFWHAGKEFFESFGNAEIIDAELDVTASAEKSGRYVGVDCDVTGKVTVECDRCLGDLDLPVDVEILLSVKFGDEDSSDEHQEGEREVIFIPQDDADMDLSQIVYDYVCLSLPMQRCHEVGECNPAVMSYLDVKTHEPDAVSDAEANPFAALKGMFEQKNSNN